MSKPWPGLLLGVVLGAGITVVVGQLMDVQRESESISANDLANASDTASLQTLPQTRIESRLERIESSIAALDQKIEESLVRRSRVPVGDPSTTPVGEEALVRALRRVERERLAALSADGLLSKAGQLLKENDFAGARRVLELMLDRALEPKKRANALTQLGMMHRQSGDLKAAAQTLQKSIETVGIDCSEGAWAAFQLMWTRKDQGLHSDAIELANACARSKVSNRSVRMHGRWVAATLSHELGDTTRTRAEYAAILADCGDAEEYSKIVEDVRRRMKQLR